MEAQQKSLATISSGFFIQIFAIPMVSVIFLPSYLAGVLKLLGSPREERGARRCCFLPTVLSQKYWIENKLVLSLVYWVLKC